MCITFNQIYRMEYADYQAEMQAQADAEFQAHLEEEIERSAGWISVDFGVPAYGEWVLISCEWGVTLALYQNSLNPLIQWLAVVGIGVVEPDRFAQKVTHWMPLPEPPKIDF